MAEATSGSPGFGEVMDLRINRILGEVHTSMPGEIVSYDPKTQSASIQPSLMRKYSGEAPIKLPILDQVPVMFPAFKNGWLRFPLGAGDRVQLHFAERSLDKWWAQGGVVDPAMTRRFSLTDAVATIGLNDLQNAIKAKGAETSVELAFGGSWIEITQEGKFKVTNGSVELLDIIDKLMTQLSTATAPPPSFTVVMPGLTILQQLLARLKA